MDAVLHKFRRSFGSSTPFFHSLSLDPPTTVEELYRQADIYSTMENNIQATTQTVMFKNQQAEKSSSSRQERSRPRLRKVKAKIKSDPETSLIKERAPTIHPPEYLVQKVVAPHSRPTRFQMACTYPDESCLEKQILVVRLS